MPQLWRHALRCSARAAGLVGAVSGQVPAPGRSRGMSLLGDLLGGGHKGPTEVVFIDPRVVLQHKNLQELLNDGGDTLCRLTVPGEFVPLISKGVNEMGDMDDPMNNWYFGKKAEIFQYTFVGPHRTKSGFTSVMSLDALQRIAGGSHQGLPSWEQFKEWFSAGAITFPSRTPPFLFAGLMVETAEAAVYKLEEGGKLTGLLISSETAGGGSDGDE